MVSLVSAFLAVAASAKEVSPTATHMEVAKELLRISHADQVLDQAVSLILPQQIKSIKSLRPDIPEKALNRFGEVFKASFRKNMQEFLDAAALTYTRHLSEADMRAIVEFYKTPAGQNLIKKQSVMMGELARLGSVMGQEIARKALREAVSKLKQEGYDL